MISLHKQGKHCSPLKRNELIILTKMNIMEILVLFTAIFVVVKGNYYYIQSDCNPDSPCISLDDIAGELNGPHFLDFSPGTHHLHRQILIHGVGSFTMAGNRSTIVCNGSINFWLVFRYINSMYVSGLTFVNCPGITYYYVYNVIISNIIYASCRSTDCLYIERSYAVIHNVLFDDTIVSNNLIVKYSTAFLANVTMTNSNCYVSLLYCYYCVMQSQYFYISNVSGLVLEVDNGILSMDMLHTSIYDYYLSARCVFLYSQHGAVNISNSSIFIFCNTRAMFTNNSTLFLFNSTFSGKLMEGYGPEQNQRFGTALEANSSNITLIDTTFKYFSGENGGAIEAKENSQIEIIYSYFSNNSARLGGALKIDNSSVMIHNTTFIDNEARTYGGAINAYNATLNLVNCSFVRNEATYFSGGGIYAWKSGLLVINTTSFLFNSAPYGGALAIYQNTTLKATDTIFDGNKGKAGGPIFIEDNCIFLSLSNLIIQNNHGGVMFIARSHVLFKGNQKIRDNIGSLAISGCTVHFEGRTELLGNSQYVDDKSIAIPRYVTYPYTAVSIYTSTAFFKGQFIIANNIMGAIGCIESTIQFIGKIIITNNSAVPSTPIEHTSRGGGVAAYQCFVQYHGNISMTNNTAVYGGGMYASTSICHVYLSDISFYSNSATMGAGIYFDFNSKLIFHHQKKESEESSNTVMKFTGNKAVSTGGAIYVNDKSYFGVCDYGNSLVTTPEYECFIQHINLDSAAKKIILFENNMAISGSSIYGGLLDRCHMTGSQCSNGMALFKAISYTVNESHHSINSGPTRLCICSIDTVNCSINEIYLSVFKGETITLNMTAVDQFGNGLEARVISNLSSPTSGGLSGVKPGQLLQTLSSNCSPLKYNVYSTGNTEQIQVYPEGPCIDRGVSLFTIQLSFKPCPRGFQEHNGSCECHRSLHGSTCNIDTRIITRHSNTWISYITTGNTSDLTEHAHCPYDYCVPPSDHVNINLYEEDGADIQCGHNRSGTLCGGCKKGLSIMLGSSRCAKCSSTSALLLFPIALVGILAVAAMLVFDLTIEAAVINGIILFANTVVINYNTLFPAHFPTFHLTIVIAWINLDLGFETCLLDGLDMYGKVWLEILFPIYLLLLAVILLFARHRVSAYWMVKLFRQTNPHAVVATIIVLTFNKFLVLLPTLFSFATLSATSQTVWLADGNITYGSGKYIALLVVGVALSVYVVTFTVTMVFGPSLIANSNKYSRFIMNKTHLKPILEAYHTPYGGKHWPGIQVIYRVLIMVMSASTIAGHNHKLNTALLSITTIITAAIKDIAGVWYHHRKFAILDSFYLAAVGFVSLSLLYIKEDLNKAIASLTTTSVITMWSIVVISYHIYTRIGRIPVSKQLTTCCVNRRQESPSELTAESNKTTISTSDITIANTNITTSFIDTPNINN